ncbi:MAG: hypothetical protein KKI08_03745 [Armatimonadetes bacterium]|nr:hypothetical protein [Armatimonadota bacterium]
MLQPQLEFTPFRNDGLFTDHYLQDVPPGVPGLWDPADLPAIRQALLALWEEQADQVEHYSEAQLEDHFIKPALAILGHVIEPQPQAGQHKPDYAFFPTDEARKEALPADGRLEYWQQALAVGDAKSWDRKLDKTSGTDAGWGLANPSFQVGEYYLARKLLEFGATIGGWDKALWDAARFDASSPDEGTDMPALKRLGVERCIYGVDINPLAVGLAKLSLWLNTVAKGQPLSFLDHRAGCRTMKAVSRAVTVEQAQAMGRRACKACKP